MSDNSGRNSPKFTRFEDFQAYQNQQQNRLEDQHANPNLNFNQNEQVPAYQSPRQKAQNINFSNINNAQNLPAGYTPARKQLDPTVVQEIFQEDWNESVQNSLKTFTPTLAMGGVVALGFAVAPRYVKGMSKLLEHNRHMKAATFIGVGNAILCYAGMGKHTYTQMHKLGWDKQDIGFYLKNWQSNPGLK